MPGFDGTGPLGQGPRTGGGFGYCPPGAGPQYGYYGFRGFWGAGRGGFPRGGGRGRVWGGGRGFGGRGYMPAYYAPLPQYNPYYYPGYSSGTPADELKFLNDNLADLEEEMKAVRNRIVELEAQQKKE